MLEENLSEKCLESSKTSKRSQSGIDLTDKSNLSALSNKKRRGRKKIERKEEKEKKNKEIFGDKQKECRVLRSYTHKNPSYNFIEWNKIKKHRKSRAAREQSYREQQNFDYELRTFNYEEINNETIDTDGLDLLNDTNGENVTSTSISTLINTSYEILNCQDYCNDLRPEFYDEDKLIKKDPSEDTNLIQTVAVTTDLSLLTKQNCSTDKHENIFCEIKRQKEDKIGKHVRVDNNLISLKKEKIYYQIYPKQFNYLLKNTFINHIKQNNNNNIIKLFVFPKKSNNKIIKFDNSLSSILKNTRKYQKVFSENNKNNKLILTEMNNNQNNDEKLFKIKLITDNKICLPTTTVKSDIKKYNLKEKITLDEYKINVSNKLKMLETFGTSVSQPGKIICSGSADQKQQINKKIITFKPIDDGSNSGKIPNSVKICFNVNATTSSGTLQPGNKLVGNINKTKSMTSILKSSSPIKQVVTSVVKINQNTKDVHVKVKDIMPRRLEDITVTKRDDKEQQIIDVETVDNIVKSPEFLNKQLICCKTPPTDNKFILLNNKRSDIIESSQNIYSRFFSKNSNKLNKPATICKRNTDNISIFYLNNKSASSINKQIRPIIKNNNIKETIIPYTSKRNYNYCNNLYTPIEKVYQIKHLINKRSTLTPVAQTGIIRATIREQQPREPPKLTILEKVRILNRNYQEIKSQTDEINNQNKCICNIENYIKNYYEFTKEPAFCQYLDNTGLKYSNHRGCNAQHCCVDNNINNFKEIYNKNFASGNPNSNPRDVPIIITTSNINSQRIYKRIPNDESLESLFAIPTKSLYRVNDTETFNINDYLNIF